MVGVGPLVAAVLGVDLPVEALVVAEGMADGETETVQATAVAVIGAAAVAVETVVLLSGQRQAQVTAIPAGALAGIKVIDAALATGVLQPRAVAVRRVAGDDVDHRHQRVGAITDGVRAAKD